MQEETDIIKGATVEAGLKRPSPMSLSDALLGEVNDAECVQLKARKEKADALKGKYLIGDDIDMIEPKPVLLFHDSVLFTRGAISMIAGRAKSRKTFFTNMLEAAYLYGDYYNFSGVGGVKAERPLIHIDTEQAQYRVYDIRKRLKNIVAEEDRMSKDDFSRLCYVFSMAGEDSDVIKDLIKTMLPEINPGLVVVDVGSDLVGDTNDIGQSSGAFRELLNLAKEYDTHICVVVHTNPNDPAGKARGHFGSEGERRCECVFLVEPKGEYSKATIKMIRHKPITPDSEYFYIDTDGLPKAYNGIPDIPEEKQAGKIEALKSVFSTVLKESAGLRHKDLVSKIKSVCDVSDRTARNRVNEAVNYELIKKEGDVYRLKIEEQAFDCQEDLPF